MTTFGEFIDPLAYEFHLRFEFEETPWESDLQKRESYAAWEREVQRVAESAYQDRFGQTPPKGSITVTVQDGSTLFVIAAGVFTFLIGYKPGKESILEFINDVKMFTGYVAEQTKELVGASAKVREVTEAVGPNIIAEVDDLVDDYVNNRITAENLESLVELVLYISEAEQRDDEWLAALQAYLTARYGDEELLQRIVSEDFEQADVEDDAKSVSESKEEREEDQDDNTMFMTS